MKALRETLLIIKMVWAWRDQKLYHQILTECRHVWKILILMFIAVLIVILGDVSQRLDHLELRINYCDTNIKDMTAIE